VFDKQVISEHRNGAEQRWAVQRVRCINQPIATAVIIQTLVGLETNRRYRGDLFKPW
jgi:hypothetical protein